MSIRVGKKANSKMMVHPIPTPFTLENFKSLRYNKDKFMKVLEFVAM